VPVQASFNRGIFIIRLFCLLIFFQGCGYHLGGFRDNIPSDIRTIAIPLFANHTQEPRIENLFTEAFRDRFYRLSFLRVTSQKENADAFLQGEILVTSTDPISFDPNFLVLEYLARVTVSVQLRKTRDGTVLWGIERLEDAQYFQASSDALLFNDNRKEAFLKIARRLSEKIVDQILVGY
jgi:outer membrane lipopolysaccharide assembly protein LptE/RlpB